MTSTDETHKETRPVEAEGAANEPASEGHPPNAVGPDSKPVGCHEDMAAFDRQASYFDYYWKYTAALRNWFVAYGIGGTVLFVTEGDTFGEFPVPAQKIIVIAFLLGVVAQIVVAGLNKFINYSQYRDQLSEASPDDKYLTSNLHGWLESAAGWIWFDIAMDLLTFITFGLATVLILVLA